MVTETSEVGPEKDSHSSVAPFGSRFAATAARLPGVRGAWPEAMSDRVRPPSSPELSTAEITLNEAACAAVPCAWLPLRFGSRRRTGPASLAPGTFFLSAFSSSSSRSAGRSSPARKCRIPPEALPSGSTYFRHMSWGCPSSVKARLGAGGR